MAVRWLVRVLTLALPLVLATAASPAGLGPAVATEGELATRAPVLLVHGYTSGGVGDCPGFNVQDLWDKTVAELVDRGGYPASRVLPVSYYGCDVKGVDITGSGPGTDFPLRAPADRTYPRAGHTNDASITRIAQDLAWFVHNEFTREGQRVHLVGHSMGGLIVREALRRVEAGDSRFPSSMDVARVLTISTPHKGWSSKCKKNTQCQQMAPTSGFIAELQDNPAPQGVRGTKWWAMATRGDLALDGSTVPCDGIPTASATGVDGVRLVYAKPCYRHVAYLNDDSQKLDAQGSAGLDGRHSLAMLRYVLR